MTPSGDSYSAWRSGSELLEEEARRWERMGLHELAADLREVASLMTVMHYLSPETKRKIVRAIKRAEQER